MSFPSDTKTPRPIIFGEVLFDCFSDKAVLGGAPFNVGWHLTGFGANPVFVSRVGDDDHGRAIRDAMTRWDMDASGLQTDAEHATGTVQVTLDNGQPSYEIVTNQAYDHIQATDVACDNRALIYHGSLALRDPSSRSALASLIQQHQLQPFVDVNLRDPWWDKSEAIAMLDAARWAKLNDDELVELSGTSPDSDADWESLANNFARVHELELLIITRGVQGAFGLGQAGIARAEPVPVDSLQDTVGAGDSFSSVIILGILNNWDLSDTLQRATAFASRVCAQRGATAEDAELYARQLKTWGIRTT
ncbi:MAG TPA: carbohydrate kinase [Chromatiales bacterium]|nr:carbohydrate kinase [Chromatiales bacterium]